MTSSSDLTPTNDGALECDEQLHVLVAEMMDRQGYEDFTLFTDAMRQLRGEEPDFDGPSVSLESAGETFLQESRPAHGMAGDFGVTDTFLIQAQLQLMNSVRTKLQELWIHPEICAASASSQIENLGSQADDYIEYLKSAIDGRVDLASADGMAILHGITQFPLIVDGITGPESLLTATAEAEQIHRAFMERAKVGDENVADDDPATLGMTG